MSTQLKLSARLVKKGFTFKMKQNEVLLCKAIMDELKNIDLKDLKLDPDFIQYICEVIENQVDPADDEKHGKPNKLEIIKAIKTKVFPQITPDEMN